MKSVGTPKYRGEAAHTTIGRVGVLMLTFEIDYIYIFRGDDPPDS